MHAKLSSPVKVPYTTTSRSLPMSSGPILLVQQALAMSPAPSILGFTVHVTCVTDGHRDVGVMILPTRPTYLTVKGTTGISDVILPQPLLQLSPLILLSQDGQVNWFSFVVYSRCLVRLR